MTNSPSTRPTRTAPTVALKGMSERASAAGGGVDAHHVGIILLVGGEDQRDHLSLVAKTIRK